jgi:DNA-binding NtrC family response regulator
LNGENLSIMAPNGTRILMLVDDEPAQVRLVSALAARAGWRTVAASDSETAIAMLGTRDGMMLDAIIIDRWHADAADLVAELRARRPALPILVLTATDSAAVAVEAMRAGASDFLVKPLAPERLLAALDAAVCEGSSGGELRPLTEKLSVSLGFDEIVGSAPKFRAALAIAAKAARARVPILIEGEAGVGKDPHRITACAQDAGHDQLRGNPRQPDRI